MLDNHIPDEFESSAVAYRILMELFRHQRAPQHQISPAVGRVLKLVGQQYRDADLSMDRIAATAGYSRYHFSRLFHREMGVSPHAYLQQFRIQRALHLITTTDLPVKQIAFESGYCDTAYFCKEFKRWTHKTPLTVRRFGATLNLNVVHTDSSVKRCGDNNVHFVTSPRP